MNADLALRTSCHGHLLAAIGASIILHALTGIAIGGSVLVQGGHAGKDAGTATASVDVRLVSDRPLRSSTEGVPTTRSKAHDERAAGTPAPSAPPGLLPAIRYYRISELSAKPLVIEPPRFQTSPGDEYGADGSVALRVFIAQDGRVAAVEVEDASLPESAIRVARAGFMHALFTPGRVGDRPVAVEMRVAVDFSSPDRP
ncbi:MAG: hypothetical protein IOMNBAOH_00259 [Rhodocyclaceae bacterium]|nr:hypothetical protein [Rhodocyclaceae bacterium]